LYRTLWICIGYSTPKNRLKTHPNTSKSIPKTSSNILQSLPKHPQNTSQIISCLVCCPETVGSSRRFSITCLPSHRLKRTSWCRVLAKEQRQCHKCSTYMFSSISSLGEGLISVSECKYEFCMTEHMSYQLDGSEAQEHGESVVSLSSSPIPRFPFGSVTRLPKDNTTHLTMDCLGLLEALVGFYQAVQIVYSFV